MFFKNLKFFTLIVLCLPTTLSAMAEDLIISYSIPPHKKSILFDTLVRNIVPGKTTPDDYHITLGVVKKVKPADFTLLGNLLKSIV